MDIWSILTKKTPFEPGKKPIRLFLSVDDDKSGKGVARAGGGSGKGVARAGLPDDPPEPGLDIYVYTKPGFFRLIRRKSSHQYTY